MSNNNFRATVVLLLFALAVVQAMQTCTLNFIHNRMLSLIH